MPDHPSITTKKTALLIFAKAPVAGFAKTRLIPVLGAKGAAALALRLLEHTVAASQAAGFDYIELCATPDASHPAFVHLATNYGLALTEQGEGDLGERMDRALQRCLAQHQRALLIGTDIPGWSPQILQDAATALQTHTAVFVPTLDGGYALVGLSKPSPQLFYNMRWSHAQVMADTRAQAGAAQLSYTELPMLADVDEPTDLVHVPQAWLKR